MSDEKLQKKLQLKPGMTALILNAPDSFLAAIQPLPGVGQAQTEPTGDRFDYVHLFAQNSAELNAFAKDAQTAVSTDGLFWISYPKKSSGLETDLTRDAGWEPITAAGYRPVRQVAVDEVWSAVRFREAGDESPGTLIDAQFAGAKAELKPIYEALVAAAVAIDPQVKLAPRKSYVALQKNKTFALIKASTRDRVDLGLKLPTFDSAGRLQESKGFGSGSITHKVELHGVEDIDEELLDWLRAAYRTVT